MAIFVKEKQDIHYWRKRSKQAELLADLRFEESQRRLNAIQKLLKKINTSDLADIIGEKE